MIHGKAADAGSTGIAASKLAQSKSSTAQVKTFADTMVTDHSKLVDDLKRLATSKGVPPSEQPSSKQQREISKLNGLSGVAFDKEYAKGSAFPPTRMPSSCLPAPARRRTIQM